MKTKYVLGFAFDDLGRCVLIEKKRPDWQAGKLNGVGGKVKPGEDSRAAMCREFYEETGVMLDDRAWKPFGRIDNGLHDGDVDLFVARHNSVQYCKTTTDERVKLILPNFLFGQQCIPNIPALVSLAALSDPSRPLVQLNYA